MPNLSSAQIHLALNHLPVFAALLASGTLLAAVVTRRGRATLRTAGLGILLFAALSTLPTYFSGEAAEEVVEDRPAVSEGLIERHEESAEQTLAVILAGGAVAASALVLTGLRRERAVSVLFTLALLSSLASTFLMARTAHLGGQIRHDEIRAVSARPPGTGTGRERRFLRDDD